MSNNKVIPFEQWGAAIKLRDVEHVEIPVKGGVIDVTVRPVIPFTDRMMFVAEVEEMCVQDGIVHMELLDCIFRSRVLSYYTNIDVSKAQLNDVWSFVGDAEVYGLIRSAIVDDVEDTRSIICSHLHSRAARVDVLASRLLELADTITGLVGEDTIESVRKFLKQLSSSDFDAEQFLKLVESETGESDES